MVLAVKDEVAQVVSTPCTKQHFDKFEDSENVPENIVALIQPSGFEEQRAPKMTPMYHLIKMASEREARGETTYNLAAGNPKIEPPREILESMKNLCSATLEEKACGLFKYTHPAGLIQLRKNIAEEVGKWQGVPDLSEDHIIMTPGAQSAIVSVYEALLQPGDHACVQTPFYPAYETAAKLWKAETKHIDFLETNFDVDMESLRQISKSSGKKLRVIALCSPSNPSGKILSNETISRIAALAREHSQRYGRDVWLLMDNTYRRMTFNGCTVPPALPVYDKTILISSFSKDISLAGERLGYVVVNPSATHSKSLCTWISNNNDRLGNLSPPSLIQHVLVDVYKKYGGLPNQSDTYEVKVNHMHKKLLSISGLTCTKPAGTFYLLPRLPDGIDDQAFADKLAHRGVLVVPGSAFGAPGHIRLAALPSLGEIDSACDVIESVLKSEVEAKENFEIATR